MESLPDPVRATDAARNLGIAAGLRLGVRTVSRDTLPEDVTSMRWLLPADLKDLPTTSIGVRSTPDGVVFSDPPEPETQILPKVPRTTPRALWLSWEDETGQRREKVTLAKGRTTEPILVGPGKVSIELIDGQRWELRPEAVVEKLRDLELPDFAAYIRHAETNKVTGIGIVFSAAGQIITTAQAARAAGIEPYDIDSGDITVHFYQASNQEKTTGRATVLAYFPQRKDGIVLLQILDNLPRLTQERVALIGAAESAVGHRFRAGYIQGVIVGLEAGQVKLELQAPHVIDRRMIGAPVLDVESNLVIGLISGHSYPGDDLKDDDRIIWAVDCSILTSDLFDLSELASVLE